MGWEAEEMERRVSVVEETAENLVKKTDRHERELTELKRNQSQFASNFEILTTSVRALQEQNDKNTKDTTKQLTETNVRVDVVSKDVKDMRSEMNVNNGVITATLSNNTRQNDQLIDLIKHGQETAAGVQRAEIATSGEVQKTTVTTNNDKKKVIIPAVVGSLVGLVLGMLPFIQSALENLFK